MRTMTSRLQELGPNPSGRQTMRARHSTQWPSRKAPYCPHLKYMQRWRTMVSTDAALQQSQGQWVLQLSHILQLPHRPAAWPAAVVAHSLQSPALQHMHGSASTTWKQLDDLDALSRCLYLYRLSTPAPTVHHTAASPALHPLPADGCITERTVSTAAACILLQQSQRTLMKTVRTCTAGSAS